MVEALPRIHGITVSGTCAKCGVVCALALRPGEGPMMPVTIIAPEGWGIVDQPEPTLHCGVCIEELAKDVQRSVSHPA